MALASYLNIFFIPETREFNKLYSAGINKKRTRQFLVKTLQISGQVSPIQADCRSSRAKKNWGSVKFGPGGSTDITGQIWIWTTELI